MHIYKVCQNVFELKGLVFLQETILCKRNILKNLPRQKVVGIHVQGVKKLLPDPFLNIFIVV